jgi:hypothetical protein
MEQLNKSLRMFLRAHKLSSNRETIPLWTIQPINVLQELDKIGSFKCDGRRVAQSDRRVYQWMAMQMAHAGLCKRPVYPVWCWFAWGGTKQRKPDLRSSWHLPRGTHAVRMTIEVSVSIVLLSWFDAWVSILNNGYVARNREEASRLAGTGRDVDIHAPKQSWLLIFDFELRNRSYWGPIQYRPVQACIPRLDKHWITDVVEFRAR